MILEARKSSEYRKLAKKKEKNGEKKYNRKNFWEQINTSLGELSSNMGQLRVEHQEHSIILHEIREDQKAMREEQQRQGRDIEELKDIIGSSRRKRHHH